MIYFLWAVLMVVSVACTYFIGYAISLKKECGYFKYKITTLTNDNEEIIRRNKVLSEELLSIGNKLRAEVSRNKSVEVRTGQIMEKLVPFLEVFKYDPGRATFIGQPIDYIVFLDDEIVFVEVKTGKSKTSKKQNNIRSLIEQGKVRFELIRLDYE